MTTTVIDQTLDLLDEIGAREALADVRALRGRLAEIDDAQTGPAEDEHALRARLVADLADGTVTAREAGEALGELARRTDALQAGRELFGEARAIVEERLLVAAKAAGDDWITALRPAVERLVEALERTVKLTDGTLADVAAGNGTAAQRNAVEGVKTALPLARRAQRLADELRRTGLVPTDVLAGAELEKWSLALRWEDATPIEDELDARRHRTDGGNRTLGDLDRAETVIRLHRDRGAMPALLTASEVVDRAGEGARTIAERAERERVESGRRAAARKRFDERLDEIARLSVPV